MSPRQTAEQIVRDYLAAEDQHWLLNAITAAIQAASNEQLERGRKDTDRLEFLLSLRSP